MAKKDMKRREKVRAISDNDLENVTDGDAYLHYDDDGNLIEASLTGDSARDLQEMFTGSSEYPSYPGIDYENAQG